jgi:hypothetical protein
MVTAFANQTPSWYSGGEYRVAAFELKGVTTNDTLDVGNYFKKLVAAAVIGVTASQVVTSLTAGISGTVITISATSLALDDVVIVVSGAAA